MLRFFNFLSFIADIPKNLLILNPKPE